MMTEHYPYELFEIQEFIRYKRKAERVAEQLLMHPATQADGELIEQCANTIAINPAQPKYQLVKTWYCKHRACPICQWRKQMKRIAQMHMVLHQLNLQSHGYRWLFLTLTVKNCSATDLSQLIDRMNQAFSRMLRRKELKHLVGHLRNTEITEDSQFPGKVHPHFHCLLLVKPSMFAGKHYIKESRWAELWQEALVASYRPRVDVRGVARDGSSESELVINHVAYSNKVNPSYQCDELFSEVVQQTKRKRLFSAGGLLRELLNSDEREPLEDAETEGPRILTEWNPTQSAYQRFEL